MKFVGIETPEYFNLSASNVLTSQLSSDINMTNLGTVIDGWGDASGEDTFNFDWLKAVKEK